MKDKLYEKTLKQKKKLQEELLKDFKKEKIDLEAINCITGEIILLNKILRDTKNES